MPQEPKDKYLPVIQKASETLSGQVELDQVLSTSLERLVKEMGFKSSAIQLVDDSGTKLEYRKIYAPGGLLKLVEKYGDVKPKKIVLDLDNPDDKCNFFAKCFLENHVITGSNLYDFTRPILSKKSAKIIESMFRTRYMAAIPLRVKGMPIGVLDVIGKKTDYSREDKILLQLLADQIALAITNAKQHEAIIEQYKSSLTDPNKLKKKRSNIKFTLRITKETEHFLARQVLNTKTSKAQYVRQLLEDEMKNDKDFQDFDK